MISPRYVPALGVILAVALVPTLIHSYAGLTVADARTTQAIPLSIAGFISRPTSRDAAWGQRRFDSTDWFERRYVAGRDEVVITVVRSYDLKRLYHHPELAVAYRTSFSRHATMRFADRQEIPVHVLRGSEGTRAVAMYVLHYDDRFVDAPIWFQIRTAGKLLLSGRQPMTLFFAHDLSVPPEASIETLPSRMLLMKAVDAFVTNGPATGR